MKEETDPVQLSVFLANLDNTFKQAAREIWWSGAALFCSVCGGNFPLNQKAVERYLRHGWPTCHNLTMELRKQAAEQR